MLFPGFLRLGVCGGGGGGAKNYQEIRRGAELILLLRTGGHYMIISPLKLISQPSPDIYCTVLYQAVTAWCFLL